MPFNPRDHFDLTPQQYHAGLDKIWAALGVTGVQDEDVFTLAAREITRQRNALQVIAGYGCDGICPYGFDTPYIARKALEREEV